MVIRTFVAFDNDAMKIAVGSPSGTPGAPIINNSDTPNGTIFLYTGGSGTYVSLNDTNNGANSNIFNDDDRTHHIITNGAGLVANNTQVEAESLIFVRALNAQGVQVGPTITLTVFSKGGVTSDVWGFGTTQLLVSGTRYVKTSGNNTGSANYNTFIPCFVAGTMIRLPASTAPVESLRPGQDVWTEDGPHPLVWVGRTQVSGEGRFAPVVFEPGTIGNSQTLEVSPRHCIVVEGARAELYFGCPRLLVPARHFAGQPGIRIERRSVVDYVHIMFDRHHIVMSNGALCESFFPGKLAMSGFEADKRDEILALFPELATDSSFFGPTALSVLKEFEARALFAN